MRIIVVAPLAGAMSDSILCFIRQQSLSTIGFFSALPAGARGERISGDTPDTPPGAAAPGPARNTYTCKAYLPPRQDASTLASAMYGCTIWFIRQQSHCRDRGSGGADAGAWCLSWWGCDPAASHPLMTSLATGTSTSHPATSQVCYSLYVSNTQLRVKEVSHGSTTTA